MEFIKKNYEFKFDKYNYIKEGFIKEEDLKVYIKKDILKNIIEFSNSDLKNELGGILFGGYNINNKNKYTFITNYIEAKYTSSTNSSITFTHESWNYIHNMHDKICPEMKIIGWHHTHPGYDIFLSSYDMFIQNSFFNLNFQVALVVDPIKKKLGFFQWKNNSVEKLNGYYKYF